MAVSLEPRQDERRAHNLGGPSGIDRRLADRRRGRPRLSDDGRLRVQIAFRCSETARQTLCDAARDNLMSVSAFIELAVADAVADYADGARFRRR